MKNKDNLYMQMALTISNASYCMRNKVGAILVKEDNIIAFGYNGTPSGFDNQCEEENYTKQIVLHAESNAIAKCAKSNYSSFDSSLYTTLSPCFECCKLIIQAGIKEVKYLKEYRDISGLEILKKANINVQQL